MSNVIRERIASLRQRDRACALTGEEAIELAVLEMDDLEEDAAMARLQALIAREPTRNRARVWLGYMLHMCSLEGADRIRELLSPVLTEATTDGAAARYVLACALLSGPSGGQDEAGRLLAECAAIEPGWVSNWEALSRAEVFRGNRATAAAQLERAAANTIPEAPEWGYERSAFEALITGRTARPRPGTPGAQAC